MIRLTFLFVVLIGLAACNPKKHSADQPMKDSLVVINPVENEGTAIQVQSQLDSLKGRFIVCKTKLNDRKSADLTYLCSCESLFFSY